MAFNLFLVSLIGSVHTLASHAGRFQQGRKATYHDPRFYESTESLPKQSRSGENDFQLTPGHKSHLLDELSSTLWIGTGTPPTTGPPLKDRHAKVDRHPLPPWNVEVRLYGKPEIRRLDPVRFADTLDFRGHTALVLGCKKVFNYRITESDIEVSVAKFRKICRITPERFDIRVLLMLRHMVQNNDLDIGTPSPPSMFPERIRASYVKYAEWARQSTNQRLKSSEPSSA